MTVEGVIRAAGIAEAAGISYRGEMGRTLDWIERNPENFLDICRDLDKIIGRFNQYNTSLLIDNELSPNFSEVKDVIGSRQLPLSTELLRSCETNPFIGRSFHQTCRRMEQMMRRGESEETRLSGESEDFHFNKPETHPRTIATGALFRFYEEMMITREVLPDDLRHKMVNSFIEIASFDAEENMENPLWRTVSDPGELDWVRGNPQFSGAFQQIHFGTTEN